jgi:uncharacterized membrane protein YgcG
MYGYGTVLSARPSPEDGETALILELVTHHKLSLRRGGYDSLDYIQRLYGLCCSTHGYSQRILRAGTTMDRDRWILALQRGVPPMMDAQSPPVGTRPSPSPGLPFPPLPLPPPRPPDHIINSSPLRTSFRACISFHFYSKDVFFVNAWRLYPPASPAHSRLAELNAEEESVFAVTASPGDVQLSDVQRSVEDQRGGSHPDGGGGGGGGGAGGGSGGGGSGEGSNRGGTGLGNWADIGGDLNGDWNAYNKDRLGGGGEGSDRGEARRASARERQGLWTPRDSSGAEAAAALAWEAAAKVMVESEHKASEQAAKEEAEMAQSRAAKTAAAVASEWAATAGAGSAGAGTAE